MKKIKILVLCHVPPDKITHTTMLFQSVLPILKKKINVELIWAVLMPKKIKEVRISENEKIIDIQNYKNFLEIIRSIEPDLVYAGATFSFMDYAVSAAAKYHKIPVLSRWYNTLDEISGRQDKLIKSYPKRFFEKTTPTDEENDSKIIMKRGRFFMYKYWFLMKTLKSIGIKFPKRFIISLKLLDYFLNMGKKRVLPEFANTMHWLENELMYKELFDAGYQKESLKVIGNPIYDEAFKKIEIKEKSKNIKVLFAPNSLFEHGLITKKQNEFAFKIILQKLSSQKNVDCIVKIHPTTQNFNYYNTMTQEIDKTIQVIKEGHILDYISKSDVLITYTGNSSIHVNTLILKKSMIICNFFNKDSGTYVKQHLAKECTNPNELEKMIFESNSVEDERKIEEFIIKYFYKNDGKSSERFCDLILKMIS